MPKCEYCGQRYDKDEAYNDFSMETYSLSYSNIRKSLCADCAIQAIEDGVEGVYFETCEECGKKFDLIKEESKFESNFSWANGTSLRDYWEDKIRCCDCALKKV